MPLRPLAALALATAFPALPGWALAAPPDTQHVTIYHRPGQYAGWPANGGIWAWGDEILVGFHTGFYADALPAAATGDARAEDAVGPGEAPPADPSRPQRDLLARSRDGGLTWTIEDPAAGGALPLVIRRAGQSAEEAAAGLRPPTGGINFTHPDFALSLRKVQDSDVGPSFFAYSYDRGRTWSGPYRLPDLGTPGLLARTSYLVEGPSRCLVFLTAAKDDGYNGRALAARTMDGGLTWSFVSWIVPDVPPGPGRFAIMPTVRSLADRTLYAVVRRREGERRWLSGHRSSDAGATWTAEADPVTETAAGNPGSLVDLGGGRLALTYGVRSLPSRICARLSPDGGRTWGPEIVLRRDGSLRPIGYTQSVRRPDGRIVTVYYFADRQTGPEQYVAATLWSPP
ncbi:MAG: exo-alpha-sialidase [Opitutaceae bacterium]|nr:exo-alpha-sialidase [Opitutaceae bacterium]